MGHSHSAGADVGSAGGTGSGSTFRRLPLALSPRENFPEASEAKRLGSFGASSSGSIMSAVLPMSAKAGWSMLANISGEESPDN